MTITAEIKDRHGIEKVSAIMPYENNRADEIQLSLISGDNKSGKWQAEWKCHNTINIEYITTVTAINVLGKSATAKVSWWDDTETVWLSGWNHRKKITLSSATASANYQVKVILTTSNFDYDRTITSGDDIRFTEANGTNLDYWIETWNTSGDSTLWVEVATISTSTIYIYYGSSSASSESNGDNTFEFFDDFEDKTDGAVITDEWAESCPTGAATNKEYDNAKAGHRSISIWARGDANMDCNYVKSTTAISPPYIIEYDVYDDAGALNYYRALFPYNTARTKHATMGWYSGFDANNYIRMSGGYASLGISRSVGWHDFKVVVKSDGSVNYYIDGALGSVSSPAGTADTLDEFYYRVHGGTGWYTESWLDCIRVRKYASPEPSATVATDEEKRPGAPGVNPSGGGVMMF